MHVRPVTQYDMQETIALARQMHGDSQFAHVPFDPVEVRVLIRLLDERDNLGLFFLMDGDAIIGMMGLEVTHYVFANIPYVRDIAMYVAPGHRSLKAARTLLKHAEQWAKEQGANTVELSITASFEADRVGKLYERAGYVPWGRIYRKGVV